MREIGDEDIKLKTRLEDGEQQLTDVLKQINQAYRDGFNEGFGRGHSVD